MCQEANWLSIIGGDLNTTAYKSDICPAPPSFKPSQSLLTLTSPAHGLVNSFQHIHPKNPKYSFLRCDSAKLSKTGAGIEKLPTLCLQRIASMLSHTDFTSLTMASKCIHWVYHPKLVHLS
jgi:hypothetical protein